MHFYGFFISFAQKSFLTKSYFLSVDIDTFDYSGSIVNLSCFVIILDYLV